jgi:hypothetical protein
VGPILITFAICILYFYVLKVVFALKINRAKSKLVRVANVDNVDGLAGFLGCGVSSLPF